MSVVTLPCTVCHRTDQHQPAGYLTVYPSRGTGISMTDTTERLTRRQEDVLFVVSQREPVTAQDVAYSLLSTDSAERSRLNGLCRRGLLDRQYTGLRSGERVGYVLSKRGAAALDALDFDDDYEPTENQS